MNKNLKKMEETKGITFNVKKTNYMLVKTGRKAVEEPNIELEMGKVTKERNTNILERQRQMQKDN